MQIIHPQNPEDFKIRNELLQITMRDPGIEFPITDEYPIVLSPLNQTLSFCLKQKDNIVAHANLWPREIIYPHQNLKIGLIGNVATHPKYRGLGLTKKIFSYLEEKASNQSIELLLLWSDLTQFYQKLGYESFSQEIHFSFTMQNLPDIKNSSLQLQLYSYDIHKYLDFDSLLLSRPKNFKTLKRCPKEFRILLSIPETYMFLIYEETEKPVGYLIIGKGADMIGVIHEWGATNPDILLKSIKKLMLLTSINDIILLSPQWLEQSWLSKFNKYATKKHLQPMALAKKIGKHNFSDDNIFIWGLDSI